MKIYCVGDSITWGATLEEDISRRWTDLVAAETEHEVINCGLNGDTTTGMLMRCHTQLFPQKPDLILFLGGTNDICHTWEYRQACANIVSVVLNAREQGIPVMVGIPLPIVARLLLPRPWAPDRDADFIAGQFEAYARCWRSGAGSGMCLRWISIVPSCGRTAPCGKNSSPMRSIPMLRATA